jgi:hypothetical protein
LSGWRRWFRSRSLAESHPAAAPDIPPRPSPHQYVAIDDWLRAWIAHQLEWNPRTPVRDGPFGRGLGLVGSLGIDSVLASDGSVWVELEDSDGTSAPWRPATHAERISLLITAHQRLPELAVLIPPRPADATDCTECNGTGRIAGIAPCQACGKRGWIAAGFGPTRWWTPGQGGEPG